MNGNDFYELKNVNKINNLIKGNENEKLLFSFYNYMSNVSSTTAYNYLNYVINFIEITNKETKDIKLDDYTYFLALIKNKTSSYQIAVYSALKKFSKYLCASERTTKDYMLSVERPMSKESQKTIDKREKGYLTKREIGKYMNSIKEGSGSDRAINKQKEWKERDLFIVLLFLNTGMRCSALCKLDIDDIDFESKLLRVTDKGSKVNEYFLSDELLDCAIKWINKRNDIMKSEDDVALFVSNQKKRMCQRAVSNVVNKYACCIEGKNITPHKLRATFGTQVYNNTHDIYLVQQAMNHSSPTTTERYIRGKKNNNKMIASNVMAEIIFK